MALDIWGRVPMQLHKIKELRLMFMEIPFESGKKEPTKKKLRSFGFKSGEGKQRFLFNRKKEGAKESGLIYV